MPAPQPPGVRALLQNDDGQVLLLLRPADSDLFPSTWCLPGGALDQGEDRLAGAKRELLEETGCKGLNATGEYQYTFPGGEGTAFYFPPLHWADDDGDDDTGVTINGESAGWAWCNPAALPTPLMPTTAEIVTALLEGAAELVPDAHRDAIEPPEDEPDEDDNEDAAPRVIKRRRTQAKADSGVTTRVTRIDRGEFKRPEKTEQGYLKLDAYATRTGVLTYLEPNGKTRRELRKPEEVFKASSLATLRDIPATDNHPPIGLLDATNTAQFARGWVNEPGAREGDFVRAGVVITDARLIDRIVRGDQRETSMGYTCDLVMQPGTWQGQEYDAIQTNIRYNHLAVVSKGRAGSEVRLRMDAAEQYDPTTETEEPMGTKYPINGVEYDVSEAVATALASAHRADAAENEDKAAKLDKMKAELEAMDAAYKKLKGELVEASAAKDKTEAKADALEEQLKARLDSNAIAGLVKARIALEKTAAKILPANTNLDAMDDQAVRLAVIKAVSPNVNLDGKSEAYIEARFDAAVEAGLTHHDSTGALGEEIARTRRDGAESTNLAEEAKARQRKDSAEGWKQPMTASKGVK